MKTIGRCSCVFGAFAALLSLGGSAFGSIGVTMGFNNQDLGQTYNAGTQNHYNYPLYNPVVATYSPAWNNTSTWDNWAEELRASGVDFVAPDIRGTTPNSQWGNPSVLGSLVTALQNRGATTKIAIFDDNAASWSGQWRSATNNPTGLFDVGNTANWVYVWDQNYKVFYQTVPDAMRFKVNGRPLIILWTSNVNITNQSGNLSKLLTYVRQQCQSTFGFNPYIIVPQDWIDNDPSSNNPAIVDGVHHWFNMTQNWSATTFNGVKIGCVAPAFNVVSPTDNMVIDPEHGETFDDGLANTVGAGCSLTLVEGFTDWEENAAVFRCRTMDASGNVLTYAQTQYDYPSQRLNILRKYTASPAPQNRLFEAEACDAFGGGAAGGTPNYYRNGPIMVEKTSDTNGGYDVGNIKPNQWLEWEEVPFGNSTTPHFLVRVATTAATCKIHFVIDGVVEPSKTLPNTGGWQTWVTFDTGAYGAFPAGGTHTVRIVFETGYMNLNWWQL